MKRNALKWRISVKALATLALLLIGQSSLATTKGGNLDYWSFSVSPVAGSNTINVYSSDGAQWDTLSGPPIKFSNSIIAKMKWRDRITGWALYLGYCEGNTCLNFPKISGANPYVAELGLWEQVTLPMASIPTGLTYTNVGNAILSACNQGLTPSVGALDDQTFNMGIQITAGLETEAHQVFPDPPAGGAGGPGYDSMEAVHYAKHDLLPLSINCHGYDFQSSEFDVEDQIVTSEEVELFLSTFSHAHTQPNAHTTCQKGRALVRVTTDVEGPVDVRLWTLGVNEASSHLLSGWASHVGSGVYQADITKWVTVNSSSTLMAMAEVLNNANGFGGHSTQWKNLDLNCSSGPGDKAIEPAPGPDTDPGGRFPIGRVIP